MTPISSVFRPPSQQLQAAFPWHRQWLEKSPSSEGTNPQRRASEWSDWTKLPAAQAFEALKAAYGGTERNQLQQAGDVCRCLGWDDPILKWRISKLWTAYFSLLRAPVSIGHKAGRCWKMLEVWSAKKQNRRPIVRFRKNLDVSASHDLDGRQLWQICQAS